MTTPILPLLLRHDKLQFLFSEPIALEQVSPCSGLEAELSCTQDMPAVYGQPLTCLVSVHTLSAHC